MEERLTKKREDGLYKIERAISDKIYELKMENENELKRGIK